MLLQGGCIDNALQGEEDNKTGFDSGRGVSFDSLVHETGDPDSATTTVTSCEDAAPPDAAVAAEVECAAGEPFTGEFVELWRVPMDPYATTSHVGRLLDGNGDGVIDDLDPMQIVVEPFRGATEFVEVYDSDGSLIDTIGPGGWREEATIGDVDPTEPGAEVLVSGYKRNVGESYLMTWSASGGLSSFPVLEPGDATLLWLTDLEGDGVWESLVGENVLDVASGGINAALDGVDVQDYCPNVSADLDRDGVEEILNACDFGQGSAALFAADGSLVETCVDFGGPLGEGAFAVGNLDADADGEFVAAGQDYIAVCDTDGTLLTSLLTDSVMPGLLGLAELDGDAEPEIVLGDGSGLRAWNLDLTPLWEVDLGGVGWHAYTLADLDGDGLHELLVKFWEDLVVLGPDGAELARTTVGPGLSAWRNQPVVADIDADGRAEIVVTDSDLVVYESPDGGWLVRESEYDWPSADSHPGNRTLAGEVVTGDDFWNDRDHNYWQARPPGAAPRPELAVAIVDLCVESCDGDAVVTVEVSNVGVDALETPVELSLSVEDGGDLLGTVSIASLASGTAHYELFRIPAGEVSRGLVAAVDTGVDECGERSNEDAYRDSPCP